ncbi:hypothetical protein B9Z55_003624 [Caenorhabditis nigoni]|uniref:Tyrosine specific protein phosphatases domain-containing protein n=1 Tax=Caenorhabditis nigoni TaxID=1611254 RepID=A0A2G5VRE2_9PELO|nr:hypothetical protein B9Z55_003624 [Caenorhabditis nigoni]
MPRGRCISFLAPAPSLGWAPQYAQKAEILELKIIFWDFFQIPPKKENLQDIHPGTQPNDPVVVMCDLGLDRSATVVLTAILIEMVLAGKAPDCDALFKKMRDQRAGCFTMSMFYTYAIRAALTYLKIKFRQMSEIPDDVKAMLGEALNKVPFVKKI